jgi:sialate O-acetylesterase
MIFQAGKPVYIFGSCLKKKEIRIRFFGNIYRFKTTDTTFCFELPALPYIKEPFDFDVVCNSQTVSVCDCLSGDVFIAAGGMNIGLPLQETFETRVAHNSYIRFFEVTKTPYVNAHLEFPNYFQGIVPSWNDCSFESAMKFSAIGYLVSQRLKEELDYPIGIISCNLEDTSIFSWTGILELCEYPSLQKYMANYRVELAKYKTIDSYSDVFNRQLPLQMELSKKIHEAEKNSKPGDDQIGDSLRNHPECLIPMGVKHYNRPAGSFETMLKTILPFSVKAVMYYQEEPDDSVLSGYEDAQMALVKSWRRAFKDVSLPFVFVQIAGYSYPKLPNTAAALIRDAQAKVSSMTNYVYLTSAVDLGEENNFLPRDKTVISKRLAEVILEKIYHRGKNSMCPAFFSYSLVENQMIIYTQANNLNLVSRSKKNLGFKISTDGETFTDAGRVTLMNNQIIIHEARKLKEVRYAFANYPHCDIYTSNDLPLLPFRIRIETR